MGTFRALATGASASALILSSFLVAPAAATPGQGFAPSPIVSGHFGTLTVNTSKDKTGKWGLILKTLDDTDIGADRLTVQAGGFSGWHAHPAPVFVTVTKGNITWYDGSDPLCTGHPYSAGQSFIEDAYVPHNVTSADGAEFVAVVIKPAGFPGPAFRLDRNKPNNCGF
ncbi:cupin domain-containing protein [Sphingomonas daechungensis]|uniref:cupin domain-containing protein n=1 Tax=Sphingomonas daechungensis TaxID=1176646 RepID=UPI0031EE2A83